MTSSCSSILTKKGASHVITHTKKELHEFRDESVKQLEKIGDRVIGRLGERVDESIEKAAKHTSTALRETLDADVISFAAFGSVLVLMLWVVGQFILRILQWRSGKTATKSGQNKLKPQPSGHT